MRRQPPALRAQALALYAAERYADFGPTLMAEQRAKAALAVDPETLRRWRLAAGQHPVRRRRQAHRQWRERKPGFGARVQLDGSHHDGFEGRGPRCVLMVMVDDATNTLPARCCAEETPRASYDVSEGGVRQHGLFGSLYGDRDSIYRCEGGASLAEQLAGQAPQTQFGRARAQLGVELILANSPQAKGRVERLNGVLQDRLVKELRLAGINDSESANRFLEAKYWRRFNRPFERAAASPGDGHRGGPRNWNEGLSWEPARVVQGDGPVTCEGQRYRRDRQPEALSLVRRKVIVRTLRSGQVQRVYRGERLKWRRLPAGAARKRAPVKPRRSEPAKTGIGKPVPAANHPWRRDGGGAGRALGNGIKAAGRAERLAGKRSQEKQTTKGTFSRELNRGHF